MTDDHSLPKDILREKNAMLKTVQNARSTQSFKNEAKANAFMEKNFTARAMEEIITLTLLALGTHENFYRDLKRSP